MSVTQCGEQAGGRGCGDAGLGGEVFCGDSARPPWGKEPRLAPTSGAVNGLCSREEQLEEPGAERPPGGWLGCREDLSQGVAGRQQRQNWGLLWDGGPVKGSRFSRLSSTGH